jgi:cytochrome c oxidase subunit 2
VRSTNGRASRARRRLITTGLLLGATVLLTACSGEQTMLDPQGPFASKPNDLFRVVFWIAVFVFVLVQGLIVFTAIRFRRKRDDDALPVQTHGNTRLEIFWTVIPALILAGIAVPTIQQVFDLAEKPADSMTIEVIGHRWWWEFRYPDSGIITANELVIPTGTPIHLEMRSEENGAPDRGVIHSFWIPALAGKQDVVPGRITTLNLEADEPGRYQGQCTEYCGLSHANMRQRAVAMTPDDFQQWVTEQQGPSVQPETGTIQAEGKQLFQANCAACHQIRDDAVASADDFIAMQAPNLTHLMSRKEFAGATLDLYLPGDNPDTFTDQPNVEQLKAWLRNPSAIKPMRPADGIGMPNLNLTEDEINKLVAYLITLQ